MSRKEARLTAMVMDRSVRYQMADLYWLLGTRADRRRFLYTKNLVDRSLEDLETWLRNPLHRRACGAAFVKDMEDRIYLLKEEAEDLQIKAEQDLLDQEPEREPEPRPE